MKKILKKYFIPHKGNDHQPHILRNEATIAAIGLLIVVELIFLTGAGVLSGSKYFATIFKGVLVDETNSNRISQKLASLTVSPILEEAARQKAEDMAKNSYFSHVGPTGKTPWEWLQGVGYEYRYAGENLAVNFIDSKDVVDAWMNSPGHRANILNTNYTEIGIGTAAGIYKGKTTVFIAEYFGKPLLENEISTSSLAQLSTTTSKITAISTSSNILGSASSVVKEQVSMQKTSVLSEPIKVNKSSSVQEELFVALENPTINSQSALLSNSDNLQKVDSVGKLQASQKNQDLATNAGSSMPSQYSSIIERTLSSPRAIVNNLLILFAAIISLALILKIFIKIEIQHPPLIVNGLLVLILIVSALILNKYIGFVSAQVL